MSFRKYIVRNGSEDAWLIHIFMDKDRKVYQYMPDAGMAIRYETMHEAKKIAKACRGKVQILRMDKDGNAFGEDIGQ